MCSIENCNLKNFENSDKCILHCDKYDWEDDEEKRKLFWSKIQSLSKNGYFRRIENSKKVVGVIFPYFEFKRIRKNFNSEVIFYKCKFHGRVYQRENSFGDKYLFSKCEFFDEVNFLYVDFSSSLSFINKCIFNKKASFRYCNFKKVVLFNNIKFKSITDFGFSCFENNLFFTNTIFFNKINLSKTIINSKSSFDGLKAEIANRETARIIKDSFEQQNNIIEANKFYALEMKEREKELESDRKEGKNLLEWVVFKTHGLASNHSQNWILPLFWILLVAMLTGLFQNYYLNECITNTYPISSIILGYFLFILSVPFFIDKIIERKPLKNFSLSLILMISGLYLLITKDLLLELPAKVINPFSLMNNSDYINGILLIIKIIIAYLIYQLIISIRQNTRRK